MRIALSGSAGTGKTTLALALSQALGLPLIPEETRARLEGGEPPLHHLDPLEGLAVLEALWRERLVLEARLGAFVADNGPLDFAAYALHHGCVADASHPFVQGCLAHLPQVRTLLLPCGVLPYERDGVRCEDPATEARFQATLETLLPGEAPLQRLPEPLTTREGRLAWALSALGAVPSSGPHRL